MNACTVCAHPGRDSIDAALAADALTIRGAAERYGLDKSSVWRHRHRHLPLRLAKAAEAEEIASAGRILQHTNDVFEVSRVLTAKAIRKNDTRVAYAGMDRQLAALQLLARVAGVGSADVALTVNLARDPGWRELRDALLAALDPFPAARRAVVLELQRRRAG